MAADTWSREAEQQAVREATLRWYEALNAMLAGDPRPFSEVYSHADDVAYMPAEGGLLQGWDAVYGDWVKQAQNSLGGRVQPRELQVSVGRDLAMSCNFTQGEFTLPGGKTARVDIRESSVLRKEDGIWKMIFHHADKVSGWEEWSEDGQ